MALVFQDDEVSVGSERASQRMIIVGIVRHRLCNILSVKVRRSLVVGLGIKGS
jgi:hypothetical protein